MEEQSIATDQQQAPAADTQTDVFAIITESVVAQLNKGIVPWHALWFKNGIPTNLVSGRPYQGINVILLASLGYEQNLFLTYKQVQANTGKVKRGEKGHKVVYWKMPEVKDGVVLDKQEKAVLRYSTVYNIAQCEQLPEDMIKELIDARDLPESIDRIIGDMPNAPKIVQKGQKSWYNPVDDTVYMAKQNSFASTAHYCATLFHQLVHSTGNTNRLYRPDLMMMMELSTDPYTHEELIAEIGTTFLLSLAGVEINFQANDEYRQAWIKKFQDDRRFFFSACKLAQKAVNYILNAQPAHDDEQGTSSNNEAAL